ncbi:hypothetical protein [Pedobacter ginsengisoli]|uniref:hypothetical protein n=1 Tax=Pedobacter ginsengisoli TaxID=363852 RepID=UPI00254EE39C|nr:hypothetical protein [Pedobacter ginsengisoli]
MKTFAKYSTLYFLFIVALSGCKKDGKKDENTTNFPITLYAEKATVVSDTKVYVKGGLLNDPKKNQELMWTYSRHFKLEQELQNAGETFMTFIAKDSVDFFNRHSPYVISRNGEMLTLTSAIESISPLPVLQNQLYHHVAKYQSIKTEGNIEISKDIRIAYGNGYSEYKIPMFAYVTSSWINGPVSGLNRRGGLVINEFNADVINRIGDRDTIIVKTYLLTVKAK